MGGQGASFQAAGTGDRPGPAGCGHLTLQSSLMTKGVSSGECRLGARIRFLSSTTSWSSGSAGGRVYTSI